MKKIIIFLLLFGGFSLNAQNFSFQDLERWWGKNTAAPEILVKSGSVTRNTATVSHQTVLAPGTSFVVGQKYYSADRNFFVTFQNDGNLVIYRSPDIFHWGSFNNMAVSNEAKTVAMQEDGNFVIYGPENSYLWGLDGKGINLLPGSTIALSNNGELLMIAPNGTILWNSSK